MPLKFFQLTSHLVGLLFFNTICYASEIKDGFGSSWSLEKKPKKVASTFLSGDEILLELTRGTSIQLLATSKVAEDQLFSNIVNELKNIPFRIGNNPEFIAKIKPDLVFIASWNRPDFINTLKKLNINTFVLSEFNSISDIEANILLMAKVLHLEEKASQIVARMNLKMVPVEKKGLRVLKYDSSGFIMGKNTIYDAVLERLGLTNAVEEKGWPKLSPEAIARLKPDLIIVGGDEGDKSRAISNLKRTPGWQNLSALSEERIIMVPERLLSAASPYIVNTYEWLSKKVNEFQLGTSAVKPSPPDQFKKLEKNKIGKGKKD